MHYEYYKEREAINSYLKQQKEEKNIQKLF